MTSFLTRSEEVTGRKATDTEQRQPLRRAAAFILGCHPLVVQNCPMFRFVVWLELVVHVVSVEHMRVRLSSSSVWLCSSCLFSSAVAFRCCVVWKVRFCRAESTSKLHHVFYLCLKGFSIKCKRLKTFPRGSSLWKNSSAFSGLSNFRQHVL